MRVGAVLKDITPEGSERQNPTLWPATSYDNVTMWGLAFGRSGASMSIRRAPARGTLAPVIGGGARERGDAGGGGGE